MARDFDHQMEKNVSDSEYEMKQLLKLLLIHWNKIYDYNGN